MHQFSLVFSRVDSTARQGAAAGITDSLLVIQRADPVGACAATPWGSVPAPDHRERHTEMPKGRGFAIPPHIGVTEHWGFPSSLPC